MDIELQLRQEDARLVFLAVAHHLGRPGSELDPLTKQPVEHGLAEVSRAMQPQMRNAVTTLRLNQDQVARLQSGMLGSITELKAYALLRPRDDTGRRSTVPGFDGSLLHLFPEVEADVEISLDIAERMLMLKRRLDERLAEMPPDAPSKSQTSKPKKGLWPFKR
ncbi:MAG TPA: hypothetical protein VI759_06695 [Dehalococcoidia bacterium]|nr:hypothetical protein [Dehalococcoidia bacterium]